MEYGFCTCHSMQRDSYRRWIESTGRAIVREDETCEWMHADDETFAETVHAHVERYATDCDGAHGNDYVRLPNAGEDSYDFWAATVNMIVSAHRPGTLKIVELDTGEMRAEWSAQTDEGHESDTATRCFDPSCAYDGPSIYDQFAELPGY